MKKVIFGKKVVTMYDSIDELPIQNFQKYNKFLLIDSGIGSDIDDIDKHISRIAKYINTDKKMAMQELQNMRQNLYMISASLSPKYMAFAALIKDIDGKPVEDLSDENLKSIIDELKYVNQSMLSKILEAVKKKIQEELELYFPKEFISAKEKSAYDKIKERTLLVLRGVIDGKDYGKEIADIDDYFFSLYKPGIFIGSESAEIKYDKQFEAMCVLISQKVSLDAHKMTVLQFYNTLNIIQQQLEAEEKAYKHHKKA